MSEIEDDDICLCDYCGKDLTNAFDATVCPICYAVLCRDCADDFNGYCRRCYEDEYYDERAADSLSGGKDKP